MIFFLTEVFYSSIHYQPKELSLWGVILLPHSSFHWKQADPHKTYSIPCHPQFLGFTKMIERF